MKSAPPVRSRAYLGLGANLGQPAEQIEQALAGLAAHAQLDVIARSGLYRSAPLGPAGQPDYCNAACVVETSLDPLALLDVLQALEATAGRERDAERWSARVLDLDLLHVDGRVMRTPRLTLPHPELHRRAFVLVPLAEIAPALVIPGLGGIAVLAAAVDRSGLRDWV